MAVIVISYSRVDQPIVRRIVHLLRAAFPHIQQAVYWDDDFEPGEPWFEQITRHIDAAPSLFVFWCNHAAASSQVSREFRYALEQHKRVVPVLLDATPLVPELSQIHGVDFRELTLHGVAIGDSGYAEQSEKSHPKRSDISLKRWLGLALIIGLIANAMYVVRSPNPSEVHFAVKALALLAALVVAIWLWSRFVSKSRDYYQKPIELSAKLEERIVKGFAPYLD